MSELEAKACKYCGHVATRQSDEDCPTRLEAKISCRFCQEKFVLFEDLQEHRCLSNGQIRSLAKWLIEADKKVESFEEMLEGC